MTDDTLVLARQRLAALKKASFVPGSNPKLFVMRTPIDGPLSERQIAFIAILAWKFRRQIPAILVPHGTPPSLSPKAKTNFKTVNLAQIGEKDLFDGKP